MQSIFALSSRTIPVHTDFGYGLLRAVSADEAARLDLSDDLEVCALGERGRVFGRPAKHTPMPSGPRLALSHLAVLPGPLCRKREDRQRRGISGSTGFGVGAEIADQKLRC